MKKVMAIFALAIIGSALIGCGAKEEDKTDPKGANSGKLETKDSSQETPTTTDK